MLKILLKSYEFDSRNSPLEVSIYSCKIANLKIHHTDERYLNIINSKNFELLIFNPNFGFYKTFGYYKICNCVLCSWGGGSIMINYWKVIKVEDSEKRDFIIDSILDI